MAKQPEHIAPFDPGAALMPMANQGERGSEMMAKQSPTFKDFNPTGDDRVTAIKGRTDELIELVRAFTAASGPEAQRRASLAVTNFENASMWAVKALFSEDAIKGDDPAAP